jgi:outer membrane receptor protein involved in Fe transport
VGERLVAVTGARGYAFRARGTPSNINDPTGARPPTVMNRTSSLGASEALRYFVTPTTMVKASVEIARRLPTTTELFGDGVLLVASPGLNPERSLNLNAGVQYDRLLGEERRLQAEVNGFWMNLHDLISLARGFAGQSAHINLGAARIRGFDVEVKGDPTPWLFMSMNATYQDARDVLRNAAGSTAPSPTYGLRLPHMPWLFGTATAEVHKDDLLGVQQRSRVFYEGAFTEEYFYAFELSRRQERRVPRAVTHTAGVEHQWLGRGLTVSAEVQNLTDARVLNRFNLPLPGRQFRAKVRYTWVGR